MIDHSPLELRILQALHGLRKPVKLDQLKQVLDVDPLDLGHALSRLRTLKQIRKRSDGYLPKLKSVAERKRDYAANQRRLGRIRRDYWATPLQHTLLHNLLKEVQKDDDDTIE